MVKKKLALRPLLVGLVVSILFILSLLPRFLFSATVEGKVIWRYKVVKELERQGGKSVLESLVTEALILSEASKSKIVVPNDEVEKEIVNLETKLKEGGTTLDEALSSQGQTREDLKKNIITRLLVEKLLSTRVKVEEAEIEKYWEENKDSLGKGTKLEDAKDNIRQNIYQLKLSEEYQKWLQELRKNSKIRYFVGY